MHGRWLRGHAVLTVMVSALAGCTPSQYAEQADRAAYGALRGGQQVALGMRPAFEVDYEPYCAGDGRRVIRVGETEIPLSVGEPVVLTLDDCLDVAFRNSRDFQERKETLFLAALDLANTRRDWNWTLVTGDETAQIEAARFGNSHGLDSDTASGEGNVSLTRRFFDGGVLVMAASLSFATDFLSSASTPVDSLLDANFTQPLLRGAWRGIAYEDQYRRERDFLISVFGYERFTQTFAVQVLTQYYAVLQQRDQLRNDRMNIERLQDTATVTRVLVRGGQRSRIEADQAEQNLIQAQVRFQQRQQSYQDALDAFKIFLGLPIEARVVLNYPEALNELNEAGPQPIPFEGDEAIRLALRTRPDVLERRADVRDAERDVELAADDFLPALDLVTGVSAAGSDDQEFAKVRFHEHERFARLELDYDLDQTDNRDAYRSALIAWDRARRDYEQFVDEVVRLGVRQSYRNLLQSRTTYDLQKRNVEIGQLRRDLAELEQRAGTASARDVLEAEQALLDAQNGLTNALISYTTTRLQFLADLGMVRVDEKGRIHERDEPFWFHRIAERYPHLGGADAEACVDEQPGAESP